MRDHFKQAENIDSGRCIIIRVENWDQFFGGTKTGVGWKY